MNHRVKLSAKQIDEYQRDGALLVKNFLSPDELSLLRQGMEDVVANPGKLSMQVRSAQGEGETLMDHFPSLNSTSLRELIDRGRIAELAGRLMQVSSAQLVLEQTFCKKSGFINSTPWHQDTPFLPFRGDDVARVWLSCDTSPRDITVQVVRGSHRWNIVYSALPRGSSTRKTEESEDVTYDGIVDETMPLAPDIDRHRDSFDILSWDVEPGDAIVFHGNILHGADGRESYPNERRAFALTWAGPELRYFVPRGNTSPTMDKVRGITLSDDARVGDHEEAFQLGWRRA